MSPVTHLEIGWAVAHVGDLGKRGRLFVTLAGVIPDLDGLGLFVSLELYDRYHHVLLHGVVFALVFSLLAYAMTSRLSVAGLSFLSMHLHFAGDYMGSGPGWSLLYLWPLSDREFFTTVQWDLASWQNFVVTILFTLVLVRIALVCGRTPVGLVWERWDMAVVGVIERWFRWAT